MSIHSFSFMKEHFLPKAILPLAAVFLTALSAGAQTINITDPDFDQNNPLDCNVYNSGAGANFFDDGGGANYSANFSDTIVLCPDLGLGSKVSLTFATNTAFTWNVDSTDTLYVFDGPDVNAPLLGAHNSVTDPNGFNHQASFVNNPSGCLTVVFVSDDTIQGTGWDAGVACGNPPQPFDVHMDGFVNAPGGDTITPSDTGIIQLCLGDSILYVGSAVFPYSLENAGTGYSQTDTSVTYQWFFSNGQTLTGDSVWFTPPDYAGYVVTLQVTDAFPSTQQLISFVRVAPRIDFSGTRVLNDSICEGDSLQLFGGVTTADTLGANPTIAETQVGGSFAGLTYLPDGSGINYETDIEISGFGTGQVMNSGDDLLMLQMTIEHSFLGDLEMMLTCPNGTSIVMINSWTGTGISPAFAGGFGGGGTYLGDAFDANLQNPGIGWTYRFSDALNTWADMGTELGNNTTIPTTISSGTAMDTIGIYEPEQTYADLIGCPINGTWTLTVRDNLGFDDGYIFDWALFFDPLINPNFQSYSSTLVESVWRNGLGDTLGLAGDTSFIIAPDSGGINYYNFQVLDDFGCSSDTTIEVFVTLAPDPITLDTGTCANELELSVSGADSALWSTAADTVIGFSPSALDTAVIATSTAFGLYEVSLLSYKNNCVFSDTIQIEYYSDIEEDIIGDTLGCFGASYTISPATSEDNLEYLWMPGGLTTEELNVSETGTYFLTVTGCNTVTDSATITFHVAPQILEGSVVCDSLDTLRLDRVPLVGNWLAIDSLSDMPFTLTTNDSTAFVSASSRGFVAVAYQDSVCATVDTNYIQFEQFPSISIIDSLICEKDAPLALSTVFFPANGLQVEWSDGTLDTNLLVWTQGFYDVTASNACGSAYDSLTLRFLDCDFFIPNVITPNQDGVNDVFTIVNSEFYTSLSLRIYNRWGGLIFNGEGENAKWDGRNTAGEIVSNGVYFFVAEIDGEESQGSLTLLAD